MIRDFQPSDETAWLRCRVLSFLETDYYDDVHASTTEYGRPDIRWSQTPAAG